MNHWRRMRSFLAGGNVNATAATTDDEEDAPGEDEEEDSAMLPRGEGASSSPLSPISRGSFRYSSAGGGAARKLKAGRKAKDSITGRSHLNSNAHESSEEESSTARLSRRSSVLVDLFALFRRSSSIGQTSRQLAQRFRENDDIDESDEEDGEYQEMSKEKLLEAIRQKKEIIEKVRLQAWNMRRKRRTLKVAQRHLQRQKAQVSKVHLYKVEIQRQAKATFRWLGNTSKYLIPWESKIKRIESHFGSVVSSYFIFLRWVLSVNITMSIVLLFFVVIPEWLADMQADGDRLNRTRHIKEMPEKVRERALELNTVLDFGGYLQYSYLFYGYYSSETFFGNFIQYNVPIAYFCVNLFILAFCLFIILKKMTSNTRRSKLSGGKQEQYVFTWKVITGWDYNIGNSETSGSLFKANVIKLREATADYNKKIKQKWTWMIFVMRLLVNTVIISMFALSVYAIYQVAQITEKDTFLKQNAVSITVVVTTILFPPIFELILRLEGYRPRTALRTHLFRVLFFYLINYFTLIYSLFKMLNNLETEMRLNEISNQLFQQQTESFHIVHNPYTYNQSYYEVVPSRSARQLYARGSSSADLLNETLEAIASTIAPTTDVYYTSVNQLPSTTVEPMRPWTTVFPNYGPFGVGVYNPKAIVVSSGQRATQRVHDTVYESRAIGPIADWSPAAAQATQGPITLNYTSSPRSYYQMYRASNYDELCWETLIGQEITKIVTTDLVLTIVAILVIDFLRDIWIRYCGSWWCWDIEGTFPEYAEFKVAENVLHLVNNQGMIWLGTILVPMLPMLNNMNLIILMYIRAWACMTCNVPARQIFRASRSSNFYFWILLLMLCMSTLPVGFVIASKKPSKNCGPFGGQERFYSVISEVLHNNLNKNIIDVLQYIMSPGIVIPVLLLMLLIIYFLVLLVSGLKAANTDLSKQLTHERTEEKKKIFELAGGGRKRLSQFTFHRPSDFNVRAGSSSPTSRRSSPRSRSPPRRRTAGASAGGGSAQTDSTPVEGASGSLSGGTSWHDASSGDRCSGSARGSPDGKRESAYRKRAAGIRRTVTERCAGKLAVSDTPFQSNHSRSDDQLHSSSKSPVTQARFPSFLPSLQSVNEDDDEETHHQSGADRNTAERRDKNRSDDDDDESSSRTAPAASPASILQRRQSTASSLHSNVSIDRTPVRLNFHQKMLVWIGLADPRKLELQERLKRQIARNKADAEQQRMEAADAEAVASEHADDVERGLVVFQSRQKRRPLKSSLRKKRPTQRNGADREEDTALVNAPPSTPRVIVERSSESASRTNLRSHHEPKNESKGLRRPAANARRPTPLFLEEADYSVASDETNGATATPADDEEEDEEEVEQIAVIAESDDTSPASRASNSSSSDSTTTASAAQTPTTKQKTESGFPLLQSRSGTDRLKVKSSPDPDNAISESSPVIGRRREDVFPAAGRDGEANRLSGTKRSPQWPATRRDDEIPSLASTSPTRRYEKRGDARRQRAVVVAAPPAGNATPPNDASDVSSSAASLLLQRMRQPSNHEKADGAENGAALMRDSFRYDEDSRLGYANPYSSYAAAMCSPITLSDYRNRRTNIRPSCHPDDRQQLNQLQPPLPYLPIQQQQSSLIGLQPLHSSYHQALQYSAHSPTLPYPPGGYPSSPQLLLRPQYPLYSGAPYEEQFSLSTYYGPQQQQLKQQQQMGWPPPQQPFYPSAVYHTCDERRWPAMDYGGQPPPGQQMYDVQPLSYYNTSTASGSHSLPYRPRQPVQRRQPQSQFSLTQTADPHQESPISTHGRRSVRLGRDGEEGGSTSGRGTMPPDYFTESPSGSSPEFNVRPKYRIAQSPMSRRNDPAGGGGYSSDTTTGVRRFDIRQKSAVGGGAPDAALLIDGAPSSPYSKQTTV